MKIDDNPVVIYRKKLYSVQQVQTNYKHLPLCPETMQQVKIVCKTSVLPHVHGILNFTLLSL
jgi:hypothetical protein